MEPIVVPAPPRSAYNEKRRVSDLLYHQLKHFQHVEKTRKDLGIPDAMARDIYTEAGAARYIAAVTNALRGVAPAQPVAAATAKPVSLPSAPIVSAPPPVTVKTSVPAKKSSSRKAEAKRRTTKKSKAKK